MTTTELQSVAQLLQAFGISVAALVGGAWTLYRYWSLRELEEAKTKIEQLKQSTRQRGTVDIGLTARFVHDSAQNAAYLVATVDCSNVGNRPEVLRWEHGRVWSAKFLQMQDGFPIYTDWLQSALVDNKGPVLASVLSPGESQSCEFLVPIPEPGIYAVVVTVPGSSEETDDAIEASKRVGLTVPLSGQVVWSAMKLVAYPASRSEKGQREVEEC